MPHETDLPTQRAHAGARKGVLGALRGRRLAGRRRGDRGRSAISRSRGGGRGTSLGPGRRGSIPERDRRHRATVRRRRHLARLMAGALRWSVVIVDFDPAVGHEKAGQRRALVVSYEPFHRSGMAAVCPITTRPLRYPGEVPIAAGQRADPGRPVLRPPGPDHRSASDHDVRGWRRAAGRVRSRVSAVPFAGHSPTISGLIFRRPLTARREIDPAERVARRVRRVN